MWTSTWSKSMVDTRMLVPSAVKPSQVILTVPRYSDTTAADGTGGGVSSAAVVYGYGGADQSEVLPCWSNARTRIRIVSFAGASNTADSAPELFTVAAALNASADDAKANWTVYPARSVRIEPSVLTVGGIHATSTAARTPRVPSRNAIDVAPVISG